MKKYFYLQLKIAARILPFVLAVTIVLILGLGVVLSGLLSSLRAEEAKKEFVVALAGDTSNEYMRWGLAALQMVEDEQFSIRIVEMPQAEAHSALEKGKITAYVVLPEGLMDKALAGEEFDPITYVTTAGAENIASYLKREVTTMVTKMVVYSQKGVYALADALRGNIPTDDIYDHMTVLSIRYADLIIHRNEFYEAEVLGVSDGLSTEGYYICAVMVVLLMLMGLPFATLYIKRDYALARMLRARGYSAGRQFFCEYGAHLLSMTVLAGCAYGIIIAGMKWMLGMQMEELSSVVLRMIPVLWMICALNMLLFTLSGNLVSGMLLQFFGVIGLCYVSGCIYPITAFPVAVQKVAAFLPTSLARQYIAAGFTGVSAWSGFGGLLAYTLAFLGVALLVRSRKSAGVER